MDNFVNIKIYEGNHLPAWIRHNHAQFLTDIEEIEGFISDFERNGNTYNELNAKIVSGPMMLDICINSPAQLKALFIKIKQHATIDASGAIKISQDKFNSVTLPVLSRESLKKTFLQEHKMLYDKEKKVYLVFSGILIWIKTRVLRKFCNMPKITIIEAGKLV